MSEPPRFSIYAGRCPLGEVVEHNNKRFEALMPNGSPIGVFNSLKSASAAIEQEHVRLARRGATQP